jgi:hypothetical protein
MSHDLFICLTLVSIHTMDAGTHVELKWKIPSCGEVDGGDMTIRLSPSAGEKYLLGDKLFIHARGAS